MKKILRLSLYVTLFLIFAFAQYSYAEEVLMPQKTKLSVKFTEDFSKLKVGETKKVSINPRSFKDKKINWSNFNVQNLDNAYLIGIVQKIDKQYNSNTASCSYYLTMKFIGLVFDEDNLYPIDGDFSSYLGNYVLENHMTGNYTVVLNKDVLDTTKTTVTKLKKEKEQDILKNGDIYDRYSVKFDQIVAKYKINTKSNDFSSIEKALTNEIKLNPKNLDNYATRGFVRSNLLGNIDDAILDYKKALSLATKQQDIIDLKKSLLPCYLIKRDYDSYLNLLKAIDYPSYHYYVAWKYTNVPNYMYVMLAAKRQAVINSTPALKKYAETH